MNGGDLKGSSEYTESIENMRKTLLFLALNLDYPSYRKFEEIAGSPQYSLGNEEPVDVYNAKINMTPNDVEYAVSEERHKSNRNH